MRSKIAIKNILSTFVLQLIVIINGFIIPKLIISNYGTDTYGLIVSITQFLSIISLFEAGIGPVVKSILYKYIALNETSKVNLVLKSTNKYFKKIAYIFIIYVVLLMIFYPIIINSGYDYLFTSTLILIISIGTFFEYYFGIVNSIYLQADKKNYIISYTQIICYILNLFISTILIINHVSIHIVKLVSSLVFIIRPLIYCFYVKTRMKINFNNADGNFIIPNKKDGFSQHIAYMIHSNTDVTILTILSNLSYVAVYSVYNMVINAIKNIVSSFLSGMDSLFGDMLVLENKKTLNDKFNLYEFIYYNVSTILFTITVITIIPFIQVYTTNINDVNYIYPIFSFILVLAAYINSLRCLYSTIIYAAGHFKQTNAVTWLEALTNLVLSIILVFKFGLIGVAIGTFVSTMIRSVYFCYYLSKKILIRNVFSGMKKFFLGILEFILIYILMSKVFIFDKFDYLSWIIYSFRISIIVSIIILVINSIINFSEFKNLLYYLRKKVKNK